MPDGQRWALEDGEVTLAEYQTAFDDFNECAVEAGAVVNVSGTEPDTGLIAYSVPAGDMADVAQACYASEFSEIDATFQVTNPQVLDARARERNEFWENVMRPCLVANGVDVPEVADADTQEVADLLPIWSDLSNDGRC